MARTNRSAQAQSWTGCALVLLIAVVVLVVAVTSVVGYAFRDRPVSTPPPTPHCLATADDHTVRITADQAWWTSIIVGTSVKRKLPARAASIAMATVYQETDIRNLDHGDRDSIGLFQQRPSQGWGTVEQIMDPYYSTGKFYDALVKVRGWESGDITEVAQAVQRSGYPEAYRRHEPNARVLASTLTGWTPAGLRCLHSPAGGDADGLDSFLVGTLGIAAGTRMDTGIRYQLSSEQLTWSVAQLVVAAGGRFGVASVTTGDRQWQHDPDALAEWRTTEPAVPAGTVDVTFAPA